MEDAISRILYRPVWRWWSFIWDRCCHRSQAAYPFRHFPHGEDKDGQSLRRNLFGLAPGGGCQALMVTHQAGGLLPHRFTLTGGMVTTGGLFSVALSLGLPPVGVTDLPALRCPDFPLPSAKRWQRPPCILHLIFIIFHLLLRLQGCRQGCYSLY